MGIPGHVWGEGVWASLESGKSFYEVARAHRRKGGEHESGGGTEEELQPGFDGKENSTCTPPETLGREPDKRWTY